jgi:hypothetical protein
MRPKPCAALCLKLAKADLTMGEAALAVHTAKNGRNHPWTIDSARVTADALDTLGRAEEATAVRERYGITQKTTA